MGRIRVLEGRGERFYNESWIEDAGSCGEAWVGELPVLLAKI